MVFVLLFVLCCIPASAVDLLSDDYFLGVGLTVAEYSSDIISSGSLITDQEYLEVSALDSWELMLVDSGLIGYDPKLLFSIDVLPSGSPKYLFSLTDGVRFSFRRISIDSFVINAVDNSSTHTILSLDDLFVVQAYLFYDPDAFFYDVVQIDSSNILFDGSEFVFNFDLYTQRSDVSHVMFFIWFDITGYQDMRHFSISTTAASDPWAAAMDISDKTDFFTAGIWESIKKLPDDISKGIKDLFMPSEDDLQGFTDRFNEIFDERFGAIAEVEDLLSEMVSEISVAESTGYIEMPLVDLTEQGIPFSFGGYQVQIIPDKFDFLAKIVSHFISVIATIAFLQAIRDRYMNEVIR